VYYMYSILMLMLYCLQSANICTISVHNGIQQTIAVQAVPFA
jgi:hypothetical protein